MDGWMIYSKANIAMVIVQPVVRVSVHWIIFCVSENFHSKILEKWRLDKRKTIKTCIAAVCGLYSHSPIRERQKGSQGATEVPIPPACRFSCNMQEALKPFPTHAAPWTSDQVQKHYRGLYAQVVRNAGVCLQRGRVNQFICFESVDAVGKTRWACVRGALST